MTDSVTLNIKTFCFICSNDFSVKKILLFNGYPETEWLISSRTHFNLRGIKVSITVLISIKIIALHKTEHLNIQFNSHISKSGFQFFFAEFNIFLLLPVIYQPVPLEWRSKVRPSILCYTKRNLLTVSPTKSIFLNLSCMYLGLSYNIPSLLL